MGTDQLLDLFHVSDLSQAAPATTECPTGPAGNQKGNITTAEAVGALCDNDSQYEDYNVEGFLRIMS